MQCSFNLSFFKNFFDPSWTFIEHGSRAYVFVLLTSYFVCGMLSRCHFKARKLRGCFIYLPIIWDFQEQNEGCLRVGMLLGVLDSHMLSSPSPCLLVALSCLFGASFSLKRISRAFCSLYYCHLLLFFWSPVHSILFQCVLACVCTFVSRAKFWV